MSKEAIKLAAEFDKRFTSMNSIDVPERVNVPRDEWRQLHTAIKQALAAPVQSVAELLKQSRATFDSNFGKFGQGWADWIYTDLLELLTTPPAQPAQQEPVGALILGGVIDTSNGPEYEEWDVEWNIKAVETLQENLVTSSGVTLMLYTTPPAHSGNGLDCPPTMANRLNTPPAGTTAAKLS